ncbi:MAG: hypothetical protein K8T90_02615 [Planctomycetes bacterium]|nr:hypothetical protein [Planctomycetota bacterium]
MAVSCDIDEAGLVLAWTSAPTTQVPATPSAEILQYLPWTGAGDWTVEIPLATGIDIPDPYHDVATPVSSFRPVVLTNNTVVAVSGDRHDLAGYTRSEGHLRWTLLRPWEFELPASESADRLSRRTNVLRGGVVGGPYRVVAGGRDPLPLVSSVSAADEGLLLAGSCTADGRTHFTAIDVRFDDASGTPLRAIELPSAPDGAQSVADRRGVYWVCRGGAIANTVATPIGARTFRSRIGPRLAMPVYREWEFVFSDAWRRIESRYAGVVGMDGDRVVIASDYVALDGGQIRVPIGAGSIRGSLPDQDWTLNFPRRDDSATNLNPKSMPPGAPKVVTCALVGRHLFLRIVDAGAGTARGTVVEFAIP